MKKLTNKDLETINFIQSFRDPALGIAAIEAGITSVEEAVKLGLIDEEEI